MTKTTSILALAALAMGACASPRQKTPTVKEHFADDFLIGAAIPVRQVNGQDPIGDSITRLHYNQVVAENCMKHQEIHPERDRYNWEDADKFVKYGEDNNMAIIGHCLVWHSQQAPWYTVDDKGNPVSADTMKQRMRDHIHAVAGRYKGRIKGWDVVNEAILEDGSYRKTPLYDILGEEMIPLAFEYAHEADPDAELYLNDYGMDNKGRRETYMKIIRDLKARGLRIDGMGMQSHVGLDYPNLADYEETMDSIAANGVNIMVTELDITALPSHVRGANVSDRAAYMAAMDPFKEGLDEETSKKWNDRAAEIFAIYKKHAGDITRITWWGTQDGMSWRNGWPIPGRTDYPLPFDRQGNMKPFMQQIIAAE